MKFLKNTILTCGLALGLSVAAMAQQKPPEDPKKIPPKPQPPVVNPAPTKPPPDTNKPKKPGEAAYLASKETMGTVA